jgi:hypothetical protein
MKAPTYRFTGSALDPTSSNRQQAFAQRGINPQTTNGLALVRLGGRCKRCRGLARLPALMA